MAQAITIALGHYKEFEDKILLIKTLPGDMGSGGIKLVLT